MKKNERSALRTKWFVLSLLALGLLLSVGAGMIGRLLVGKFWAQGLVELFIQVPGALFWAGLMPAGSMFASFPPELFVVLAVAGLSAFCSWKFHFHRQRLADENKARDLKDL
ncbi:MAG: hypothetical protein V9E91_00795 [Burkholderiaceae bacterium]|jgi:hypothetical protein